MVFFYGTNVLASHIPADVGGAPQRAELSVPLQQVFGDERFNSGKRTEPQDLQSGGRAVYSLMKGAASASRVGYAIARPRDLLATPTQLFDDASEQDVRALPLPALGGGALLLCLVGLLFTYLERDVPLRRLLKKTAEIGGGERERLIVTEWRGRYRKLADAINHGIEHEVERAAEMAPSSKKKANLDEILGPTPQSSPEPFFGFADDAQASPAPAPPAPPAAAPAPPVAAPAPAAVAPAPPIAPTAPAAAPPVFGGPAPVAAAPAAAAAVGLAAAAPMATPATTTGVRPSTAPANGNGADFDEESHFREVFDQYVSTRQQCGESTDNLTFEKFGVTLRRTRDQIISKHSARAVRFSVQVKQGKAALKALPIKK